MEGLIIYFMNRQQRGISAPGRSKWQLYTDKQLLQGCRSSEIPAIRLIRLPVH